jgi:hypothetical protein
MMTGGAEPPSLRPVRRTPALPPKPAEAVEMLQAEIEFLEAKLAEEDQS